MILMIFFCSLINFPKFQRNKLDIKHAWYKYKKCFIMKKKLLTLKMNPKPFAIIFFIYEKRFVHLRTSSMIIPRNFVH